MSVHPRLALEHRFVLPCVGYHAASSSSAPSIQSGANAPRVRARPNPLLPPAHPKEPSAIHQRETIRGKGTWPSSSPRIRERERARPTRDLGIQEDPRPRPTTPSGSTPTRSHRQRIPRSPPPSTNERQSEARATWPSSSPRIRERERARPTRDLGIQEDPRPRPTTPSGSTPSGSGTSCPRPPT